jgi:hypothetical protein
MRIELLDYGNSRKAFNIPEKGDILVATIQILSGDEVLKVITKDGELHVYDASNTRIVCFDDGEYIVYSTGIDLFENERWLARESVDEGCVIAEGVAE